VTRSTALSGPEWRSCVWTRANGARAKDAGNVTTVDGQLHAGCTAKRVSKVMERWRNGKQYSGTTVIVEIGCS
jgi:hypothetical protein